MSLQVGEYFLKPAGVLLVCSHCNFREPAEEVCAGLDARRWYQCRPGDARDPPAAYRCRCCGRLRYVDESIEINAFDVTGLPAEPVKVA